MLSQILGSDKSDGRSLAEDNAGFAGSRDHREAERAAVMMVSLNMLPHVTAPGSHHVAKGIKQWRFYIKHGFTLLKSELLTSLAKQRNSKRCIFVFLAIYS